MLWYYRGKMETNFLHILSALPRIYKWFFSISDSDSSKSLPKTTFSVRNSSTTSSSADPSNGDTEKRTITRHGVTNSRPKLVHDGGDQVEHGEIAIEACNLQRTTDSDVKSSSRTSSARSAFKKPRKKPHTPTKIKYNNKDVAGADKNSEMQSLPSEKPKVLTKTVSAEPANSKMRSFKVRVVAV